MKSIYSICGSGQNGSSSYQRPSLSNKRYTQAFYKESLPWHGRICLGGSQSNINLTSSAFHNPARPNTAIKLSALDTVWLLTAPMVASAASAAGSSSALNPNTQSSAQMDVLDLLLHNPALAALVAFLALVVVPRVIMASIRIIALPAGIFLVLYVAATHPSETQSIVVGVYSWTSAHPVLTSGGILVLATLLLLPSFLLAAGSAAVILALSQVVAMDLPNLFGGNGIQEISASNPNTSQNPASKAGDNSSAGKGGVPVLAQTTPLPVPPLPAVKLPFGLSTDDVEKLSERLLQQGSRNNTTVAIPALTKTTAPIKTDAADDKSEATSVDESEEEQKKPNRFTQFIKRFRSGEVQQAGPGDNTTSQSVILQTYQDSTITQAPVVQADEESSNSLVVTEAEPKQKKPRRFSLFGRKSKPEEVKEAGLEDSATSQGLIVQKDTDSNDVLVEKAYPLGSSLIQDRPMAELRPETVLSTDLSQTQPKIETSSRIEQQSDVELLDSGLDNAEKVTKSRSDRLLEILERS